MKYFTIITVMGSMALLIMEHPVEMKISLGNILTIIGMAAGFIGVLITQGVNSQGQRSDLDSLSKSFAEMKQDVKDLSARFSEDQRDQAVASTHVSDRMDGMSAHFDQIEAHLKSVDSKSDAVDTRLKAAEA